MLGLCRGLARKYNMPLDLAYTLAPLSLYDIVLLCDDSGAALRLWAWCVWDRPGSMQEARTWCVVCGTCGLHAL